MKKLIVLIIFAVFANKMQAQENFFIDYDSIKRNGLYLEAYAVAPDFVEGYLSLNYERFINRKRNMLLRIGIYPSFSETSFVFPLTINWITGSTKKHHFEYGIGPVMGFEHFQSNTYFIFGGFMLPLMYRFQKQKGFFLRTGMNIYVSYPSIISPSISLGYKF
jgi:hypothetical protein